MPTTTVEQLASRDNARKSLDDIKNAFRHTTKPGYLCRVDMWFELLWYAYQPESGISATAHTSGEALHLIAHQFAAYMECEYADVTTTLI